MSEAKSVAALTGGLLARKGSARPAMQPQLYSSREGDADGQRAPIVITLRPQAAHSTRTARPAEPRTLVVRDRAAFTLRLDRERHHKLRLTSKQSHRSAQSLVTEALDRFLAGLDGDKSSSN